MGYLLDTDFILNSILGKNYSPTAIQNLRQQRLAVSIITLAELYEGAYHHVDPEELIVDIRTDLADFSTLYLTDSICLHFAQIRAHLRRRGELIPDFDLLIASTALEYDLTLITGNISHFKVVPDLRVLSFP